MARTKTYGYSLFVLDKSAWPTRHSSMLFGGMQLNRPEYIELWAGLESNPTTPEVIRNLPVRHPLLWLD